jgi:hypothetical protein
MNSKQSFCLGYVVIKSKKIKRELTTKEINQLLPQIYNAEAFSQGMIDALNKDPWRYNQLKG